MQRHGIGQQAQRSPSGSIPHDRVTIPQMGSSRSLALDRPRQSTTRYPPAVANLPTVHDLRRHPPLIRQPPHGRTTCCIGSIPISQLARGTQIPIAPAARPYVPLSAVSFLGGFQTPAAEYAALSLMRPASETLHKLGHRTAIRSPRRRGAKGLSAPQCQAPWRFCCSQLSGSWLPVRPGCRRALHP